MRKGTQADLEREIGDAFAWLVSVANLAGVDVETFLERYATGCPKCAKSPCACPFVK